MIYLSDELDDPLDNLDAFLVLALLGWRGVTRKEIRAAAAKHGRRVSVTDGSWRGEPQTFYVVVLG